MEGAVAILFDQRYERKDVPWRYRRCDVEGRCMGGGKGRRGWFLEE